MLQAIFQILTIKIFPFYFSIKKLVHLFIVNFKNLIKNVRTFAKRTF